MKTVELVKGIHSSALGFGCASILGSVDAKLARYGLNMALDSGINHLDLARSYGYGEAEDFVGKIIKGRRDEIVLTSKFGIEANWKARLIRPVKPLFRGVLNSLRNNLKRSEIEKKDDNRKNLIADSMMNRVPITADRMTKSLETTLTALKTDYLDYFFIHEPLKKIEKIDEILSAAEKLKVEGKIRAFGLAYLKSQEYMHKSYLDQFDILQFNSSPGGLGYEKIVEEMGAKSNILFSPIKGGSKTLKPKEKLIRLFEDFPNSVVLCTSFNEKHLKQNISLIS